MQGNPRKPRKTPDDKVDGRDLFRIKLFREQNLSTICGDP